MRDRMPVVFIGSGSQGGGESRVIWIHISRVRKIHYHLAKAKATVILTSQFSIHPPPRPSPHSPVIIYLPRGGNVLASGPDLLPSIALSSNATVVRLNYRLSAQHPYPNPIHDVLAGYDWITSHLCQGTTSADGSPKLDQARRIGVCGELIGGSLAGMLALTECHTDEQGISAAILGNPIADWTSIFPVHEDMDAKGRTHSQLSKTKRSQASGASSQDSPTIDSILRIRKTIFPKAAKFFDPFASPSLFFCTPAMELSSTSNLLSPSDDEAASSSSAASSSTELGDSQASNSKKRRHRRTYPPSSHTNLQIPRIRIEVGKENILHDQGVELAQLIRKSTRTLKLEHYYDNTNQEQSGNKREEVTTEEDEERKELIFEREGPGLWAEKEAHEVGRWLGRRLAM